MKRTVSDMEDKDLSTELAPWVAATCFAFLLALCSGLKGSTITQPTLPERSVPTANTSQDVSVMESLSLEQLMEAVIERSESHPQVIVSFLEIYLAREAFRPESDSARLLREYIDALINLVTSRCPSTKTGQHAITYADSSESNGTESEPGEIEPTENLLSQSPPSQNAEPPNGTTEYGMESETDQRPAESTIASTPALSTSDPTVATADINTSDAIKSSPSRAESSTKRWKVGSDAITTAIIKSVSLVSPQPTFLTRVNNVRESRGPLYAKELVQGLRFTLGFVCDATVATLQWCEMVFRTDIFQTSQGLFYLLALTFGGCSTPLLSLVPYDGVVVLVQLIINLMCYAAAVSLPERKVDNLTLELCVNRLLLFSVYTCMCRILPIDNLGHNAMTWATVTGLCAWTLAVPCVVHGKDNGRSWESSSMFLRR
jgi:hypothetical protein